MQNNDRPNNATPTMERCVTSYPTRRAYNPGVVYPPSVPGVEGAIDLHCHAHEGQQDALALAKLASESGMRGILYKSIGTTRKGRSPADDVAALASELRRWADANNVDPIDCWAGYVTAGDGKEPSAAKVREQIDAGVKAVWFPVHNHANTLNIVGGRHIWWDKAADPAAHTEPLTWDEALRRGFYLLDENGRLKDEVCEIIRIVQGCDVALFFGHATRKEQCAIADFGDSIGFERMVIDHPYSPFINLTIDEMREFAQRGVTMNFTYDELSPLLGVDPAKMYAAIRAVGPEHCTLSSDAGEALFPNSVECMRLIRGYMAAFGMSKAELDMLCVSNPARVVGVDVAARVAK
jgi:hypothetical protein